MTNPNMAESNNSPVRAITGELTQPNQIPLAKVRLKGPDSRFGLRSNNPSAPLPLMAHGIAALATALALITPTGAKALEAYPATAFHQSIGVNAHLGHAGIYSSRLADVKRVISDLGILNLRGRVNGGFAQAARELQQCCNVETLARIDTRFGDNRQAKVDPSQIEAELNEALSIGGAGALVGFEGPNEYSHYQHTGDWDGDLRDYMARLRTVVRGKGLSTPIVGPTVFMRSLPDIRQIGNISSLIDASNLHMYINAYEPSYRLDEFMNDVRSMAPGDPVWVTEFGYHNGFASRLGGAPISELAAGKYLPRWIALMFSRSPRGKFFIYELLDEGNNPADHEQNRGLVRYNFTRKAAFYTLQRLIQKVRGGVPGLNTTPLPVQLSGQTSGLRSLLLQKSSKQYLLLLWQEVRSWDPGSRRLLNVAEKSVSINVGRNARFSVTDTLPFPNNPSIGAPPLALGTAAVEAATVQVPDHIVIVQIDL